jgi:hypothetical protein
MPGGLPLLRAGSSSQPKRATMDVAPGDALARPVVIALFIAVELAYW